MFLRQFFQDYYNRTEGRGKIHVMGAYWDGDKAVVTVIEHRNPSVTVSFDGSKHDLITIQ